MRKEVYAIYQEREKGENLFKVQYQRFLHVFEESCLESGLPPLHLHDLRKVAVTWFWIIALTLAQKVVLLS